MRSSSRVETRYVRPTRSTRIGNWPRRASSKMADRFLPSSLPAIGHSGTVGASLGSGNHGGNRSCVSIRNRWPHRGHAVLAKGTFLVSLACSLRQASSPTLSSLSVIRRTAPQTGRVVDLLVVEFFVRESATRGHRLRYLVPPPVLTNYRCSTGEVCVEPGS